MSPRKFLLALLALLPIGSAVALSLDKADRSFAIYPPQQLPIRFDHDLHLAQELECDSCHEAEGSTRVSDRLLPGHPGCEDCHDIAAAERGEKTDPDASCATCHVGFDEKAMTRPKSVMLPPANLIFDHSVHVKKEIACERCHGQMGKVKLATRAQLPKMELCLECHHQGGEANGACTTCHLAGPDGRVAKRMPDGSRLIPEAGNPFGVHHTPDYEFRHGHDAFAARSTCNDCHNESECLACHDAAIKSLKVHPNDWITLHPVVAKHQGLECQSCHNYQSFCVSCHERVGIGQQAAPELRAVGLRVHPPGWLDERGPNHHGVWASRDIASCASCHREEACIACHGSTTRSGGGANPHPPGFRAQCGDLFAKNARVCLKCHAPTDFQLRGCR